MGYTLEEFCLEFGILFYEVDVYPFAYAEEWLKKIGIQDDEGNVIDEEIILDADAINDTMRRGHCDLSVEVFANRIFVVEGSKP